MDIHPNQELLQLLADHPLFRELEMVEREDLAAMMTEKRYDSDSEIFREGDPGGELMILGAGSVEVQKQRSHGSGRVVIARFDRGGVIGEMSLVDRMPRSASVISVQPTRAWVMPQALFDEILLTRPALGVKLLKGLSSLLSQRLRNTSGWFADVF
ncbi:MAG: cyclic nucleotide-binding domain-containing protein [Calditrichaeota bacterium]|nr:cyclic nucleotide-binding domain-containing protein [Calditrichota bacterium]